MRSLMNSFAMVALCGVVVWATTTGAQEPLSLAAAPDLLRYDKRTVSVLQWRSFDLDSSALFSADRTVRGDEDNKRILETLQRALREQLDLDPRLRLQTDQEQESAVRGERGYRSAVELIRDRYHMGRDLYDDLNLEGALRYLEQAERSAYQHFLDVIDPQLLARIQLVLGQTRLELKREGPAHLAFRRMLALDPNKGFRRGYYPESVEQAFERAMADLLASAASERILPMERQEELAKALGADLLVSGQLARGDGELRFHLFIYDAERGGVSLRENWVVYGDERDVERLSRVLSRWLSCLAVDIASEQRREGASSREGLYVDSNFAHAIYLGHPTRQPFNNLGFSLNVNYQASRQIDVGAKVTLLTSVVDPLRDLQGNLTSIRFVLGSGVVFGNELLRGFVRPGIDILYLGDYLVITDPDCKFFGGPSPRCSEPAVPVESRWLGGINLASGVGISLGEGLYLSTQLNFSLYFALLEDSSLNYLLSPELGVGYHFK